MTGHRPPSRSRTAARCQLRLLAILSALSFVPGSAPLAAAERPNIVILLADDLGYGELGCQGNPEIPTPHIDSIASAGVRWTSGYVTAPFCSASRAGLLTGRYQTRFGYEHNPIGALNTDPHVGLPASEQTLGQLLQDAGYATGLIGKWHLGGTAAFHPQRRGFDEFFGFLHEGHYYVPPPWRGTTTWLRRRTLPDGGHGRWTSADGSIILSTHMGHNEPAYDADNPILRGGQPIHEQDHLTDAITRESVDFIRRHRERPFCLLVSYNAVHSPLQAPRERLDQFAAIENVQRRIFAAMLSHLDESVGHILAALDHAELTTRTLVIFLSDNGGPTRELTSSNAPLRGGKGELYEGGLRIPFLCQWPGRIPAGKVNDTPVTSLDLFATAVELAGDVRPRNSIDGLSLLSILSDPKQSQHPTASRTLYWRVGNRAALRQGDWKIVRQPGRGQASDWQLFDLQQDLSESNDLANASPQRLEELLKVWKTFDAEMVPALWNPRP